MLFKTIPAFQIMIHPQVYGINIRGKKCNRENKGVFLPSKKLKQRSICIFFRTEGSNRELSQKEEQMKEKHVRCRFQEQLERWQPQSVSGKQPMAEKAPVLFHMVSSSA